MNEPNAFVPADNQRLAAMYGRAVSPSAGRSEPLAASPT